MTMAYSLPQGSVLDPLLFFMYYISPVRNVSVITPRYNTPFLYANVTKEYYIRELISHWVKDWFHCPFLIPSKTEVEAVVLFPTRVRRQQFSAASSVDVAGTVASFREDTRLLDLGFRSYDLRTRQVHKTFKHLVHKHNERMTDRDSALPHRFQSTSAEG